MKHTLPILSRNIFKIVVVLTFVTLMTTVIQAQAPPVVEPEQESKWKKAGQEIKEAAGAVGEASKDSFDKAREESSELWDKAREESEEAWDKTKEGSGEVWDKTKEGSKKIWDKTKETTAEGYDAAKEKVHEMTTPEPVDVPKEPLTPPAPAE
ncbi:hypothetical protein [Desulfopila sp. IMCC35008]|uniref:hypothetical protein n=1 Tax=Desulfopila sp. IMCC35008 TaxID=2653858 RepID=UPI0013D03501|nr:hypothetical protein [Desulfopila sp. IMCC35008]